MHKSASPIIATACFLCHGQPIGINTEYFDNTPDGFPMAEDGTTIEYNETRTLADLDNTSLSDGFSWYFDYKNPRHGNTKEYEFRITKDTSGGSNLGAGNVYHCAINTNNVANTGDYVSSITVYYTGYADQTDTHCNGIFSGDYPGDPADDARSTYSLPGHSSIETQRPLEFRSDASTAQGTQGVGFIYDETNDELRLVHFGHTFGSTNHPETTMPSGYTPEVYSDVLYYGEVTRNEYWITLTNGSSTTAYTYDYASESWSSEYAGGIATGASEDGSYLVGLKYNTLNSRWESFILGPSTYTALATQSGYDIELFDINDLGIAVGRATDLSNNDVFPVTWDSANDELEIYDGDYDSDSSPDYLGLTLGRITDSGFGLYETSGGDKASYTLKQLYTTTPEDCPADMNSDGELTWFDISSFMSQYNDPDAGIDFNRDGVINYFDVSAFTSAYNGGCSGYDDPEPMP